MEGFWRCRTLVGHELLDFPKCACEIQLEGRATVLTEHLLREEQCHHFAAAEGDGGDQRCWFGEVERATSSVKLDGDAPLVSEEVEIAIRGTQAHLELPRQQRGLDRRT